MQAGTKALAKGLKWHRTRYGSGTSRKRIAEGLRTIRKRLGGRRSRHAFKGMGDTSYKG